MHKAILVIAFAVATLIINSCEQLSEQEKLAQQIEMQETKMGELLSERSLNKDEVKTLLDLYESYYKTFPTDTLAANFLMKAGQNAMSHNMMGKAIRFFDYVEKNYKKTSHYPMAVFMKGFVYDQLGDTAKARKYYMRFIDNNPNHKLADDARISIKNLGKSLEEIVKSFEEQKKDAE